MNKNGTATYEARLDSIKESVRNLVDRGSDTAGSLKHRAVDVKDSLVSGGSKAIKRLGSLIKAHPIAAVAIGVGVGYLTIRVIRR